MLLDEADHKSLQALTYALSLYLQAKQESEEGDNPLIHVLREYINSKDMMPAFQNYLDEQIESIGRCIVRYFK